MIIDLLTSLTVREVLVTEEAKKVAKEEREVSKRWQSLLSKQCLKISILVGKVLGVLCLFCFCWFFLFQYYKFDNSGLPGCTRKVFWHHYFNGEIQMPLIMDYGR